MESSFDLSEGLGGSLRLSSPFCLSWLLTEIQPIGLGVIQALKGSLEKTDGSFSPVR